MDFKSNLSKIKNLEVKPNNHWSLNLLKSMKDLKSIVYEDHLTVVIKDKYPKAEVHYLVCPKEDIRDIKSVKFKHLSLLKHMHKVGKELIVKHEGKNFLFGYHSEPSMVRLHLHVLSDDFNSPFLKTKKHWNSFTTEFFLNSETVIKKLETTGELDFKTTTEIKSFMEKPLKCHKCNFAPKNMPDLKRHLTDHLNS